MCGITGIISHKGGIYKHNIESMTNSLSHRGPDDMGFCIFRDCLLGHTRLSLVDLIGGKQPMFSKDKSLAVVFNGEIYGYKDIKKKITDYYFITESDTELLLVLYQIYKERMLEKLPGMFSFAIWDDKNNELFCARDRFGEKPFYYAIGKDNEFIFSSEIKGLLASELVEPKLDNDSVSHYLKKLYVHPGRTIYKNIFNLPPAHYLKYKDGNILIKSYWSLPMQNNKIAPEDAVIEFKRLFEKAIKNFLIADVPVGAFLSGGLDSSTVVGIASRYNDRIKTFSFGFNDETNELHFAREMAKKYNTDHAEILEKNVKIGKLILEMQRIYDEPFADPSNIPMYLISKLASKYVKTVLTGDGADELLGGYDYWYQVLNYYKKYKNHDFILDNFYIFFLKAANKLLFNKYKDLIYIRRGIESSKKFDSIAAAHLDQTDYFNDNDLRVIKLENRQYRPILSGCKSDSIDDALRIDLLNYLPGDILTKIDRASMANSLELRSPFLDVDFSSFCISLPDNLKISGRNNKRILREAYSDLWTKKIRRRGKQGFGADVGRWFKNPDVQEIKISYLENKNKKIYNLISYEDSVQYVRKNNFQTWALLNLSVWLETHNY